MEARTKVMIRTWLPAGWDVSGPAQLFDPDRGEVRTRSWDIVIHRPPKILLPPVASPETGYSLLPLAAVSVVMDTKTNFSDPRPYERKRYSILPMIQPKNQLEFLGAAISKTILIGSSSTSCDDLLKLGTSCGLSVFSLGRYRAGPVSHGEDRVSSWQLERFADGSYPLQRLKAPILLAIDQSEPDTSAS